MSDTILIKKLLGATYAHVAGDVPIINKWGSGPEFVSTAEALVEYVSEATSVIGLDLHSTDGVAGVAIHYDKKKLASADFEKLEPSFIVEHCKEEWVTFVYLVGGADEEILDLVQQLNVNETEEVYADTQFEIPLDAENDWHLSDFDVDKLDADEDLTVYSCGDLWNAFFDPAEDKQPVGLSADEPTSTLNDAKLYGELNPDVLKLPIKISMGTSQEDKVWKTTPEFSFGDFITTTLSIHRVGDKNGHCFVTGSVADKKRNKNSVLGLYMMGLDVDSGASLDATFRKVQELGLFAVFYTTHSHLTTQIKLKQDRYYKWCETNGHDPEPTTETVRKFLYDEAKYEHTVVDQAEYIETIHDGSGMHLVIETRPIEKFRIVFPLASPYVIADQKKSQRDAIIHWENMILGMGAELGIAVDRAARDPSRLFFLPRHAKGRSFEIRVANGKALDWKTVKLGSAHTEKMNVNDPFEQAAAVMGGRLKGRPTSPTKGIDLMKWAAERADGFVISDVFKDYCDDRLRDNTADGKYTCECPFDDEHSNAGDPDDKGCYIQDAGSASDQFNFRCSHDSCSGRDRLKMLEKAMNDGWFPDEVLTDQKYDTMIRDEDQEESEDGSQDESKDDGEEKEERKNTIEIYDRAIKLAEAAQQGMASDKVEAILKLCTELAQFDRSRVLTVLAGKLKLPLSQLNGFYKTVEQQTQSGTVDDGVYDAEALAKSTKRRFKSLKESKKPVVVIDDRQQAPTVNHVVATLSRVNKGQKAYTQQTREGVIQHPEVEGLHVFFRYGDAKIRVAQSEDGSFKPEPATKDVIASVCKDHLEVVQIVDSNAYEPIILPEWVAKLVVVDTAMNFLPLDGFATLPYYTPDHKLVTKLGYNEMSKKILRMKEEAFRLLTDESKGLIKYKPTLAEVEVAKSEIMDFVFADFPFDDGEDVPDGRASRAHLWCLLLQSIVRDLITGPCPHYLIDKPSAGTGASLLVSSAVNIATGNKVGTTALSENEEEVRKAISANYSAGKQVIFFDNVNYKLTSGFFANLATAEVWEDRMLGQSEIISVKNRMQTIFAGNNVEASEENMRRMLLIKLDFKDDPTTASRTFKVNNLEKYVEENKTDLFAHLLTLVNYWISSGAPIWEGKPLTGFEGYCKIMGGILKTCGIEGFLENRHLSASANSSDRLAWNGFIQEWISKIGVGKYVHMKDIAMLYVQMENQPLLYVNGGGKVQPTEDETRVYAPMQRVIDKQTNQIFRVFFKGEETKVTIKKTIDREKAQTVYGIEMVEERQQAA